MAIEALNGAMAYQATQKAVAKPAQKVDNTEVTPQQNMPAADKQTITVKEVTEKQEGQGMLNGQEPNKNEQIRKAVEQMNKKMQSSEALFGIHDETNRLTIKIVDKETKEVLKELPPEKTLDLIAKAWELAGLMVDEKR